MANVIALCASGRSKTTVAGRRGHAQNGSPHALQAGLAPGSRRCAGRAAARPPHRAGRLGRASPGSRARGSCPDRDARRRRPSRAPARAGRRTPRRSRGSARPVRRASSSAAIHSSVVARGQCALRARESRMCWPRGRHWWRSAGRRRARDGRAPRKARPQRRRVAADGDVAVGACGTPGRGRSPGAPSRAARHAPVAHSSAAPRPRARARVEQRGVECCPWPVRSRAAER